MCIRDSKYTAQAQNDAGENEEYNMREFYRVRYTKDRMYLLEFERTMDEIFDENNKVYYSKALSLGIANSDVEYMSNSEGSIVSFVQQGNIYSYAVSYTHLDVYKRQTESLPCS